MRAAQVGNGSEADRIRAVVPGILASSLHGPGAVAGVARDRRKDWENDGVRDDYLLGVRHQELFRQQKFTMSSGCQHREGEAENDDARGSCSDRTCKDGPIALVATARPQSIERRPCAKALERVFPPLISPKV